MLLRPRTIGMLAVMLIFSGTVATRAGSVAQDHAIFGAEDIAITGTSITVEGNVHANRNVQLTGSELRVEGVIEAGGDVRAQGPDISALAVMPRAQRSLAPTADFSRWRQIATEVRRGDTQVQGVLLLRGLLYVQGNAVIRAVVVGTGGIVAEGDLSVERPPFPQVSFGTAAFAAGRDLVVRGNGMTVRGVLFAPSGEVRIEGSDLRLQGVIMGRQVRVVGTRIRISHDPAVRGVLEVVGGPVGIQPPAITIPRPREVLRTSADLYVAGTALSGSAVEVTLRRQGESEILASGRTTADGSGRFQVLLRLPLARLTSGAYSVSVVAVHPSGLVSSPTTVPIFLRLDAPE